MSERTPTLAEVIRNAIEGRLVDLHTALPAQVISFDKDKQSVDVQPQIQRKFKNGDIIDLPVIADVPLMFPRAGTAFISFPIREGDQVLLIFCERSIDRWVQDGGIVDPDDTRKHDLSDAIAIPGLYPFGDPVEVSEDDIIIANPRGNTLHGSKDADENVVLGKVIKKLLSDIITILGTHFHVGNLAVPTGPMDPASKALLDAKAISPINDEKMLSDHHFTSKDND